VRVQGHGHATGRDGGEYRSGGHVQKEHAARFGDGLGHPA